MVPVGRWRMRRLAEDPLDPQRFLDEGPNISLSFMMVLLERKRLGGAPNHPGDGLIKGGFASEVGVGELPVGQGQDVPESAVDSLAGFVRN